MKLRIEAESTVRDVQEKFQTVYPYLQIHFYKGNPKDRSNFQRLQKISADVLIKDLTLADKRISISIDNNTTVLELLGSFGDIGLEAEVCRKSGNHWVATSLTADWTLQRQSTEAMLINAKRHELP